MKFLVLNGPNLNLLGIREPKIYGTKTYRDLCTLIEEDALSHGDTVTFVQSNHEGELVDAIGAALGVYDGILLNPAAYTHTSVALLDALLAVNIPTVEVHLSDPDTREDFRRVNFIRSACIATVKGEGMEGYLHALSILREYCR